MLLWPLLLFFREFDLFFYTILLMSPGPNDAFTAIKKGPNRLN